MQDDSFRRLSPAMFAPSHVLNSRFEILNLVAGGGMGEVYRARDLALGRIVALKFLRDSRTEADFDKRLRKEASTISHLNHPNICTLYDVGQDAGLAFLVLEFLEGETLEQKLARGPLPEGQALKLARQAAAGLEHAHRHGVSHGDLKPGNLMLTGTELKILDFGLAKVRLKSSSFGVIGDRAFETTQIQPGIITGTPAYMAPEQVRGEAADERSDIFSFGAILYEMLSGKRPFTGRSIQELFASVVTSTPNPIMKENLNPILERIVFRCLEKDPNQRFQYASELRFPLELVGTPPSKLQLQTPTIGAKPTWLWAGVIGVCIALLALTYVWWRSKPEQALRYHQVTFRRGSIETARFAPEGQAIVYDAAWEGRPSEIFESQLQTPEARALGFPNSYLASVARSGELMILQVHRPASTRPFRSTGTLARVAFTGGSPREILDDVYAADSSPDGTALAVMQVKGSTLNVQYPLGFTLCRIPLHYEPKFRIATDGKTLAVTKRSRGESYVSLYRQGVQKESTVAKGYGIRSLAWISPRELVFSGLRASGEDDFGLFVTADSGAPRLLARFPYDFQIQDVWKAQRYLLKVHHEQSVAIFHPATGNEVNLSWLDHTHVNGLSADGGALLTSEVGQGGGDLGSVYLRKTDGSPATKLCSGIAVAISPDAKWVLARLTQTEFVLVPTAAGRSYPLQFPSGASLDAASWFPDGNHIALTLENEQESGCYVQDLNGGSPAGPPHRMANLKLPCKVVSPDGQYVATHADGQALRIYRLSDGTSLPLPGVVTGERALSFSADGRFVYVASFQESPARASISRIEIAASHREVRAAIAPADRAGVPEIDSIFITPDGKQLAYSFHRVLNDLFVADLR